MQVVGKEAYRLNAALYPGEHKTDHAKIFGVLKHCRPHLHQNLEKKQSTIKHILPVVL